jgi:hypothetical protein
MPQLLNTTAAPAVVLALAACGGGAAAGAAEREFTQSEIAGGKASITVKAHGGFVAVFK